MKRYFIKNHSLSMPFGYVNLKIMFRMECSVTFLAWETFLAMDRSLVIHLFIPAVEDLTANLASKIYGAVDSVQVLCHKNFSWEFLSTMITFEGFVIRMFCISVKNQFCVAEESHVTMFTLEFLLYLMDSLDVAFQTYIATEFFLADFTRECDLFMNTSNVLFQIT